MQSFSTDIIMQMQDDKQVRIGDIELADMLDGKIKVSCIVPVYNTEVYLCKTLASLLSQSLRHIEVICINDRSTDASLKILKRMQSLDTRLRIIDLSEHRGAAVCRNIGLSVSQGEFVIFLDSDDFFYKDMLQETYGLAIQKGADLVVFGYEKVSMDLDGSGNEKVAHSFKKRNENREYTKKDVDVNVLRKVGHVPWNKLVRKSMLIQNRILFQDIPCNNDIFYSMAVTITAQKVVVSDKVLVKYHYGRRGSLSQKRKNRMSCIVEAFSRLFAYVCDEHAAIDILPIDILFYILNELESFLYSRESTDIVRKKAYERLRSDPILIKAMSDNKENNELPRHCLLFINDVLNDDISGADHDRYLKTSLILIKDLKKRKKKIALWGCGALGKRFIDMLDKTSNRIDYVVDMDPEKQGTRYGSYQICGYMDIVKQVDVILVLNGGILDEVEKLAENKQIIDVSRL